VSDKQTVRSGGISFGGLLAIVFITLKLADLTQVATWSWWWVLSPLWIPIAAALVIVALFLIIHIVTVWCE
jgi:hypothetical protein